MKLNIFLIPDENIEPLRIKLGEVGMCAVYSGTHDGWQSEFFFSVEAEPLEIPWVQDFSSELSSLEEDPKNTSHYAAYIWQEGSVCFAISFGKSHFYLREFCDNDFGLSMAKRIGDKDDVRQKAARRYAGRSRKQIRSYLKESSLDIESGESVDYLHAATRDEEMWGTSAKFGASLALSLPIRSSGIPDLLSEIRSELTRPELFSLPRTEIVRDKKVIEEYDRELVRAIMVEGAEFEGGSHQLVGVDFVFAGNETYYFQRRKAKSPSYTSLGMDELRSFIQNNSIIDDQILEIKIRVQREDSKPYSQSLKKALEYSIENDKVFLRRGEWVRFNDDYAEFLDQYIDTAIEIDTDFEDELRETSLAEPDFNKPENVTRYGYETADKDFTIITLRKYVIEAWDLKKDKTAYAVKFGDPQKLGYACDQASNVLEIYRNEPATFKNIEIDTYCLWFGLARSGTIDRLSEINSIIFKQKLEAWARKCQTMNVKPTVRLTKKIDSSPRPRRRRRPNNSAPHGPDAEPT